MTVLLISENYYHISESDVIGSRETRRAIRATMMGRIAFAKLSFAASDPMKAIMQGNACQRERRLVHVVCISGGNLSNFHGTARCILTRPSG